MKNIYPSLFSTLQAPKSEELIAVPYRFDGSKEKAKEFFENGMTKSFQQIYKSSIDSIPVTIYYAFKQNELETDDEGDIQSASKGWETILSAIIQSGFCLADSVDRKSVV